MSVRLRLSIFLCLLFLISIGNLFLTYKLEINGEEKLKWVIHTHEVISDTDKFISGLKDAETGQRGYLLTQSASYLEPYYAGIKAAQYYLEKLQIKTLDNAEQQEILRSVTAVMQQKFNEMAETVQLTESDKLEQALMIIDEGKGKYLMDKIRFEINHFISSENILLEARKGEFKSNRTQITTLISVGIVSMFFLAILTFMFLRKNLFSPLNLLLSCTKKMEQGDKLQVNDVIEKDELGDLLTAFFKMNEKVHANTEQLDYKAHHDNLTGLKNRSKLYEELELAMKIDKSNNKNTAVFFLDLDNFKTLNDTFGHDVGDLILQETALRLKAVTRSTDSVFRIGGDEFLLIVRNINEITQVSKVAEEILNRFKSPMVIEGHTIDVYPSVGVATSPVDSSDSELIIKYSDIAMYESKRDKKISYRVFDEKMLKVS